MRIPIDTTDKNAIGLLEKLSLAMDMSINVIRNNPDRLFNGCRMYWFEIGSMYFEFIVNGTTRNNETLWYFSLVKENTMIKKSQDYKSQHTAIIDGLTFLQQYIEGIQYDK